MRGSIVLTESCNGHGEEKINSMRRGKACI